MKKIIVPFVVLFISTIITIQAQKASIELTFSSINGSLPVSSDDYTVTNLTQGGDTVLYYPDTVLVLDYVGVQDNLFGDENSFSVSKSFPNPAAEQSKFEIYIPNSGNVAVTAINLLGKKLCSFEKQLSTGKHLISFYPGGERFYTIVVSWKGINRSIKIIGNNQASIGQCSVRYEYPVESFSVYKSGGATKSFGYNYGDELLIVGNYEGGLSQLRDIPSTSKTYQLQFGKNIPCPGTPTVSYMGKVYNALQVLNQCWM